MDVKQIKSELWSIGQSYPTLGGLLKKAIGESSVGHRWAMMLAEADVDDDHLSNVFYEFTHFERELPEQQDRLPFEILEEAKRRTWKDRERFEQYDNIHKHGRAPWRDAEPASLWCRIIKRVLAERVTADQLDDLVAWEKGAPRPAWMGQEAGQ